MCFHFLITKDDSVLKSAKALDGQWGGSVCVVTD